MHAQDDATKSHAHTHTTKATKTNVLAGHASTRDAEAAIKDRDADAAKAAKADYFKTDQSREEESPAILFKQTAHALMEMIVVMHTSQTIMLLTP